MRSVSLVLPVLPSEWLDDTRKRNQWALDGGPGVLSCWAWTMWHHFGCWKVSVFFRFLARFQIRNGTSTVMSKDMRDCVVISGTQF